MIRLSRTTKGCIYVFLIMLIWLHIITKFSVSDSDRVPDRSQVTDDKGFKGTTGNGGTGGSLRGIPGFLNVPEPNVLTPEEITLVSAKVAEINMEQEIFNEEKFGPVTEDSFVLVIQVHTRVEYLTLLIESLSHVQLIESALVIFSHDVFVPELNEAIQKIDFTRVMQIFYPTSIQLNPHQFPGESPDDCARDISTARAQQTKCRNWEHPDGYGHYREARYTQTKHHWWWKANFVFNSIQALQNYSGVITFLEEDHYLIPDALWVLNLMETLMTRNLCRGCNLLSLGTYLKTWNIRTAHDSAIITSWVSSKHNMGMAFNRTMWTNLKACTKTFCEYDDYNWDWSLLEMSYNCLKSPLTVLHAKAPRIFHIGDCGVHHKKKTCDPVTAASAIDVAVKQHESFLFPETLSVETLNGKKLQLKKGNGGWGDIRDHQLCHSF